MHFYHPCKRKILQILWKLKNPQEVHKNKRLRSLSTIKWREIWKSVANGKDWSSYNAYTPTDSLQSSKSSKNTSSRLHLYNTQGLGRGIWRGKWELELLELKQNWNKKERGVLKGKFISGGRWIHALMRVIRTPSGQPKVSFGQPEDLGFGWFWAI